MKKVSKSKEKISFQKAIQEALLDGKIVNVSKIAKTFYGEVTVETKVKSRTLICDVRKKVEEATGKIVKVEKGDYFILDFHGDEHQVDQTREEGAKRTMATITKMESQFRALKTMIERYPELAPLARSNAMSVINRANAIELNTKKSKRLIKEPTDHSSNRFLSRFAKK